MGAKSGTQPPVQYGWLQRLPTGGTAVSPSIPSQRRHGRDVSWGPRVVGRFAGCEPPCGSLLLLFARPVSSRWSFSRPASCLGRQPGTRLTHAIADPSDLSPRSAPRSDPSCPFLSSAIRQDGSILRMLIWWLVNCRRSTYRHFLLQGPARFWAFFFAPLCSQRRMARSKSTSSRRVFVFCTWLDAS